MTLDNYDKRMIGNVEAVSRSEVLSFSKTNCEYIDLRAGFGVKNEACVYEGPSKIRATRCSSRETKIQTVRLLSIEIIEKLRERGFRVRPGVMGEHITTGGIDISDLPLHTHLHVGPEVVIKVVVSRRDESPPEEGRVDPISGLTSDDFLLSRSGIEGIVIQGGRVRPNDLIEIELPIADFSNAEREYLG
ncbi:MAG: hypothetical protein ACPGN3_00155 [Opitutales bacterium]